MDASFVTDLAMLTAEAITAVIEVAAFSAPATPLVAKAKLVAVINSVPDLP